MNGIHVKSSRELRNNFTKISKLNKHGDAILLTTRGKGTDVLLRAIESCASL